MQVGRFWLITINTINGPWHVSSLNDGRGIVKGSGSWYVVNKENGRSRRIGPVRSRGKNWLDDAVVEAKNRNTKLGYAQN